MSPAPETTAIGEVRWRDLATIEGTIRSVRMRPWADQVASIECTVLDGTGGIELVFLGRQRLGGVHLGRAIRASGRVGAHHGRLAILNPMYELLDADDD
ncbi:MAG: OB-fold nucleic acid binding domain-containing protein [Acidimicrobiia bacterium]